MVKFKFVPPPFSFLKVLKMVSQSYIIQRVELDELCRARKNATNGFLCVLSQKSKTVDSYWKKVIGRLVSQGGMSVVSALAERI